MNKHRLSFLLSWAWAATGIVGFAILVNRFFMPVMAVQFKGSLQPLKPLFWGTCIVYFMVAWFMISERRLPYSNNFEVLFSTALILTCLLVVILAAMREFYSGTYLAVFFVFQVFWLWLEVYFRNRYVEYRFAVFPTDVELDAGDFPEHRVMFQSFPGSMEGMNVDATIVDFNYGMGKECQQGLAYCQNTGIPILPLTAFLENTWGRIPVELVKSAKVLDSSQFRPYLLVKPFIEWLMALAGVVLLFPVMAIAAAAVRVTSEGPVLFRQLRVGLGGREFAIYKLRTMVEGSEKLGSYAASGEDERLTSIGNFLRRTHIDELPQLFNVLKGDMAIVGPRPETVELTKEYEEKIPYYGLRTVMRPGVTSWALVHQGNVSGTPATSVKLSYDLYYLKHATFMLDFYTILKTLWVMIIGIETLRSPEDLRLFGKRKSSENPEVDAT